MAKKVEKKQLVQTKGTFKFIGKVTRIEKDGAFKEENATKGKNEGKLYRSLRFGIKTSDTNDMTVSMYDFEPTEIFLWNSEKKKKDSGYKGDRVSYEKWQEQKDELSEKGFAILQSKIGLDYDEKGKLVTKSLPSFVSSKKIFDGLTNADSVVLEGDIRYSSWENQNGDVIPQTTYTIKRAFKMKNELDFTADDFEETTYFEQEMVFVDAKLEKKEKKVYVTGRIIDYNQNFADRDFVLDYSDGADGTDAGMVKLADAFLKKFKFGDLINAYGEALNRVILSEVKDEDGDEKDDLLASLGGRNKPKQAEGYVARTYINEMQITGVQAWDKKEYTEEDFVSDELVVKEDDDLDLGGKASKKNNSPFDLGEDDEDDDSDLPF